MDGVKAAVGGMGFIVTTRAVWPYALVPVLLLLVLSCGFAVLGLWGANWVSQTLLGEPREMWGQAGGWLLSLTLGMLALVLALLLALALAQPLSGFALEAIVRAQEKALLGQEGPQPPFLSALLMGLQVAVVTVIVGGLLFALLFLIDLLVPPVVVVTVPLKFLLGAWLLAWGFLDYPLGLRGLGLRARWQWIRRHFTDFTAFGATFAVIVLVPGLFLLILPMGVAGATRLVVSKDGEKRAG